MKEPHWPMWRLWKNKITTWKRFAVYCPNAFVNKSLISDSCMVILIQAISLWQKMKKIRLSSCFSTMAFIRNWLLRPSFSMRSSGKAFWAKTNPKSSKRAVIWALETNFSFLHRWSLRNLTRSWLLTKKKTFKNVWKNTEPKMNAKNWSNWQMRSMLKSRNCCRRSTETSCSFSRLTNIYIQLTNKWVRLSTPMKIQWIIASSRSSKTESVKTALWKNASISCCRNTVSGSSLFFISYWLFIDCVYKFI